MKLLRHFAPRKDRSLVNYFFPMCTAGFNSHLSASRCKVFFLLPAKLIPRLEANVKMGRQEGCNHFSFA